MPDTESRTSDVSLPNGDPTTSSVPTAEVKKKLKRLRQQRTVRRNKLREILAEAKESTLGSPDARDDSQTRTTLAIVSQHLAKIEEFNEKVFDLLDDGAEVFEREVSESEAFDIEVEEALALMTTATVVEADGQADGTIYATPEGVRQLRFRPPFESTLNVGSRAPRTPGVSGSPVVSPTPTESAAAGPTRLPRELDISPEDQDLPAPRKLVTSVQSRIATLAANGIPLAAFAPSLKSALEAALPARTRQGFEDARRMERRFFVERSGESDTETTAPQNLAGLNINSRTTADIRDPVSFVVKAVVEVQKIIEFLRVRIRDWEDNKHFDDVNRPGDTRDNGDQRSQTRNSNHRARTTGSAVSSNSNDLQVITGSGASLKWRIVFECSSRERGSKSLNGCLLTGPKLNPDPVTVLSNFRLHPVVVAADIEKAYMRIAIGKPDQRFFRFLWRPPESSLDKKFHMQQVTWGAESSGFQLAATVRHHLKICDSASQSLSECLYADDFLQGFEDDAGATDFTDKIRASLGTAGMNSAIRITHAESLTNCPGWWFRLESFSWPQAQQPISRPKTGDDTLASVRDELRGIMSPVIVAQPLFQLNRYSSASRAVRVLPKTTQFCCLARRQEVPLPAALYRKAENELIRWCQQQHFRTEISNVIANQRVSPTSKLAAFNLFLDDDGLLRARTRLTVGPIFTYDEKNPIVARESLALQVF